MSSSPTESRVPAAAAATQAVLEPDFEPVDSSAGVWLPLPAIARALESGQLDEAQTLLNQADSPQTDLERLEFRLLRARLYLRQGRAVQALREIERARLAAPNDGRVYATAAELYCSIGKLEDAKAEVRRGLAVDGGSAALERAQGVTLLQIPGAASKAREHLLRALELEPDLAFAARPLAQAHLLVGRASLRAENPLKTLKAARAGLELYPDDFELLRLHADALLAVGSLLHATEIFEGLLAEGHAVEDDLALASWRAGMGELIRGRRSRAVDLFARARELGIPDEALGTAARLLGEEARARVGRGVEAYEADRLEDACEFFAQAVHLDPNNLAAGNHLAVTYARLGMSDLAIEGWTRVLSIFDETGSTPPEPVHLNLARAFLDRGENERARKILAHYEPEAMTDFGSEPVAAELSAMVDRLESEHRAAQLQRAE